MVLGYCLRGMFYFSFGRGVFWQCSLKSFYVKALLKNFTCLSNYLQCSCSQDSYCFKVLATDVFFEYKIVFSIFLNLYFLIPLFLTYLFLFLSTEFYNNLIHIRSVISQQITNPSAD